jgi:hypothetical protein
MPIFFEDGYPRLEHLKTGEFNGVLHEFRTQPIVLGGPDVLFEPALQWQVVRQPPEEDHG